MSGGSRWAYNRGVVGGGGLITRILRFLVSNNSMYICNSCFIYVVVVEALKDHQA